MAVHSSCVSVSMIGTCPFTIEICSMTIKTSPVTSDFCGSLCFFNRKTAPEMLKASSAESANNSSNEFHVSFVTNK